ncbi:MAG: apolipoprotein N-acyltransferase, partial [bacterium]
LWIVQIADVGGVYLVSFLIVVVNSSIYAIVRFRDLRFACSSLLLLLVANLYGAYRVYIWQPEGSYRVKAGLVQGNINLAENREYYAKMYFEELPRLAQQAAEKGAKWILLPEAQNPYIFEQDFYFKNFWSGQARKLGAFILFNSASIDKAARGIYYNSAYQLDPDGEVSYRYDKVHLVPFGEYLPFADWLTFARPLVEEVSSFHPGSELRTGNVGELRFGTVICYEAIFPEISRDYVNLQAGILVNLTNDAWFGPTAAPKQHLQMAAFRAIENRKTLLRAANSGYSAVVSVRGEIDRQTSLFSQEIIVVDVEANSTKTPYSFLGNGLNIAIIMGTCASLLLACWRRENPIGR